MKRRLVRTPKAATDGVRDGLGDISNLVGDTGIEPVTSSVSGKRATAAPIAQDMLG